MTDLVRDELLVDFDHNDPAVIDNPYPYYEHARSSECPVLRGTKYGGFWMLTRYEDVYAALHDPKLFTSAEGVTLPHLGNALRMIPIEYDPPVQSRYRHSLLPLFSPAAVATLEPTVRAIVREQIDEFIEAGEADLAQQLAVPVPPIVLAHFLGVSREKWRTFRERSESAIQCGRTGDHGGAMEHMTELALVLLDEIDDRRRNPGKNDLIESVVTAEVDGRQFDDDEALATLLLLAVAGHETTVGGIGNMLLAVATQPGVREFALRDPSSIPLVVEEALRFESPVQGLVRHTTAPTKLAGVCPVGRGETVFMQYGAADRDPAEFPEPDRFIPDREPNRHVAFGVGAHRCLGAPLARLEMRVALEEVLARLPDFTLRSPESVERFGGMNRGVEHLPVVFTPSPRAKSGGKTKARDSNVGV